MAGKAYNAGTIFLQVVPVFDQLQNQIKEQARAANGALKEEMGKGGRDAGREAGKGINEELEKAGKEGSERYSGAFARDFRDRMRGLNKELSGTKLHIGVEDENVQRTFAEIEARAKALRNVKIGVDVTSREAAMEIAKIEMQLRLLQEQAKDIQVKADLKTAHAQLKAFVTEIQRAHPEIKIDADFKEAQRALGAFQADFQAKVKRAAATLGDSIHPEVRKIKAELDEVGNLEIGVDIDDAEAKATVAYLQGELSRIDGENVEPHIRANVGIAMAQLELLQAKIREIDGTNIDIDTGHVSRSIGDTANNFRALNGVLLAAVILIPALVPLIGALGGALLALGPAIAGVGAGIGTMVLGFSGIGNAVQALGQQQKTASKDTETAANRIRKANESIADAERSLARTREDVAQRNADAARAVADAKRSAARQEQQAARQVAEAERSSAQAVKDALRQRADAVRSAAKADRDAAAAQRDLLEARKQAQKELADTQDQIAQNKLDERQAVIDLFNATVVDTAARQDGGTTNLEKEQASINLAQAQLRLKKIREEGQALAEKDKKGIDGTDAVQNAQDALTAALERQKEAHDKVGEAAAKVDQARIDGARRVADAVRAQQEAERNGARSIADAERNQARAQADGRRSIADAQRALTRAHEDYQAALNNTPASVAAVQDAMDKLGPAGQRFARWLFGLREGFYAIRDAAQEQMLPAVQSAMESVMAKYGSAFPRFVTRISKAVGDLFRDFGKMLTNPLWSKFFGMINDLGPKFTKQFGHTVMNWMSVFARLMIIAAPWAEKLSKALLGVSKHALAFVNSKRGTDIIRDFLAYAEKVGPKVWDFFKNLWGAAVNLGKALAPIGALILGALDGILKLIAHADPKVLGAIVVTIITLVIAFQALNAVLAFSSIGLALFEAAATPIIGPILLIVGGVILLIGVLVALYTQSDTARKIINGAFSAIGDAADWLWKHVLKPFFEYALWAWGKVGDVFSWTWKHILKPVFDALGAIFKWLWQRVVKPYLGFVIGLWKAIFKSMKWYWDHILWPVIDLFGKAIWKLYSWYFKKAVQGMKAIWDWLGEKLGPVYTKYLKPVFDKLGTKIGELKENFRKGVEAIGNLWDDLKNKLAKPINWVIREVVNNGLVAGFNKIAKFVGSDPMPKMSLINLDGGSKPVKPPSNAGGSHGGALNVGAATGGVLPGWSPGADVHHYTSPTGGSLHLSGGEGILRPEVTAEVTPWLHRMNRVARLFGSSGVRRALSGQAFARGGVFWPTTGRITSTYRGHDGVDINGPGQDYGNPIFAYRDGRISYVGSGRGYGAPAIFERPNVGPEVVYGHASRAIVHAGQLVKGGQVIGYVGSTGNSTGPHLHFGVPGGTYAGALALLGGATNVAGPAGGASAGGGFHLPGWLTKVIGAPIKWAKGLAEKGLDSLGDHFGNNGFVKLLKGVGEKIVSGIGHKVEDLISGIGDAVTGPGSAIHVASASARAIVQKMAAARGWTGAEWHALDQIVSRESGWDPNAANPSSSARGLFQKMTSIHGAIESTVKGQALWGLNYIAGRYGDPIHALQYWNAHGNYADGGVLGGETSSEASVGGAGVPSNGTMMYDNGGYLPPGLTTVLNLTGKPEPVFTADQFANFGRGEGDGGFTYAPTFNASDLTAADVAHDLEFAMRKHGKLGRYGSRRS